MLHDMRLAAGAVVAEIEGWPFPGRIALRERPARGYSSDGTPAANCTCSIAGTIWEPRTRKRNWRLRSARRRRRAHSMSNYRILARYFSNHPKLDWHDMRETARVSHS